MPRRKIWAMLKKRKSMPMGMRKKWTNIQRIKQWVLRCRPKKRRKKSKEIKIAHTFQKAFIQKRES
jgi:hypothetical protein